MNIEELTDILRVTAENGHSPRVGLGSFSVWYQDDLDRLRTTYFQDLFRNRKSSTVKYIVGPYGAGKTHFLRHLIEIARDEDCITAEIQLNKEVDFQKGLVVYSEIMNSLELPKSRSRGIESLIKDVVERILADPVDGRELVSNWLELLKTTTFKQRTFGRVLTQSIEFLLNENYDEFDLSCRWLEGEISNKETARSLGMTPIPQSEHNLYGRNALISLFQFIKLSGYRGTVIGLDEAEQGLSRTKRERDRIHSVLQSQINTIHDEPNTAAMLVYCVTPDTIDQAMDMQALAQRISTPTGTSFFEARNTYATTIDLREQASTLARLQEMGSKLIDLFYDCVDRPIVNSKEEALLKIADMAQEIFDADNSSSNRRAMAQRVAIYLLELYGLHTLEQPTDEGEF